MNHLRKMFLGLGIAIICMGASSAWAIGLNADAECTAPTDGVAGKPSVEVPVDGVTNENAIPVLNPEGGAATNFNSGEAPPPPKKTRKRTKK